MLAQHPRYVASLVIASALLVSSTVQAQYEPAAEAADSGAVDAWYAEEEAPPVEEAPPAEEASSRPERMKIQAVGIGYHAVLFRTENGDRYALHGPSVAYDYFVGRRWGFAIHGEAYFPLFGRYTGESPDFRGGLRNKYDARHYGTDLSFMAAYRADLTEKLFLFAAVGYHVQTFTVTSGEYLPVQAITMGFGASARLQWNFHPHLFLGANFLVAFDPFDMIKHQNPSTLVVPLSGALSFGVRYGNN
jgi:hypothetical protein